MTGMMQRMYHVAVVCPGFGLGVPVGGKVVCVGGGGDIILLSQLSQFGEKKASFLTLVTSDTVTQAGHVDIQQ